jgi:hypothetical protein
MIMLAVMFFSWWYGEGWLKVAASFKHRLVSVGSFFSVNQLLGTLFAPWRRIITYPGASLGERLRAWGDNLFSRIIGFVVRVFVLLAAATTLFIVSAATIVELLLWPLLPVAIPSLIIVGLTR